MALIMKDNGKMINMMVLVYLMIEMVIFMNVILWMVKKCFSDNPDSYLNKFYNWLKGWLLFNPFF